MAHIHIPDPSLPKDLVEVISADEYEDRAANFAYHNEHAKKNHAVTRISYEQPNEGEYSGGGLICVTRNINRRHRSLADPFSGTSCEIEEFRLDQLPATLSHLIDLRGELTSLSYEDKIDGHDGETDIEHRRQIVLIEREAQAILEERGIIVSGFKEDILSMESIEKLAGQTAAIEHSRIHKQRHRALQVEMDEMVSAIQGIIDNESQKAGVSRLINFEYQGDSDKLDTIRQYAPHLLNKFIELHNKLAALEREIYDAEFEVVDENFKHRMAYKPEAMTLNPDMSVKRNIQKTLKPGIAGAGNPSVTFDLEGF